MLGYLIRWLRSHQLPYRPTVTIHTPRWRPDARALSWWRRPPRERRKDGD